MSPAFDIRALFYKKTIFFSLALVCKISTEADKIVFNLYNFC